MKGLRGDDATAHHAHGKRDLMDWLKRFEGLSPETAKTRNFKF